MTGVEYKQLKNIPKVIYEICKSLAIIFHFRKDPSSVVAELLAYHDTDDVIVTAIKKQLNKDDYSCISNEQNVQVLMRIMMDWFAHLKVS